MAFTVPPVIIGSNDPVSGASPRTIAATGVVGRTYLAACGRYSATDDFLTMTDNGGNTWNRVTFAPTSGSVGRRVEAWVCTPTAPFTQITYTLSNTLFATVAVVELMGGTGVVDAFASDVRSNTGSTTPAPVTGTPTKSNTMAIAWMQANPNNVSQVSVASPFTKLTGGADQGPVVAYAYNLPSGVAAGAQWTLSSATGTGHAILFFEEAAPPPPTESWSEWNGTTEVPLTLQGVWNGTTVEPVTFDTVTT